jgi:hypothetical protein
VIALGQEIEADPQLETRVEPAQHAEQLGVLAVEVDDREGSHPQEAD